MKHAPVARVGGTAEEMTGACDLENDCQRTKTKHPDPELANKMEDCFSKGDICVSKIIRCQNYNLQLQY